MDCPPWAGAARTHCIVFCVVYDKVTAGAGTYKAVFTSVRICFGVLKCISIQRYIYKRDNM